MIALVGYTGFVGSNIYASAGDKIEGLYNSKTIEKAYGTCPEILIYAGLRAEKYLANYAPEKDMDQILQAEENIKKINPKRLVLISTIDVFKTPRDVDENSLIEVNGLQAYGYNRYQLELWVREYDSNALIIRLPGLFGKNIKKNFIYDYIHRIPRMLSELKYNELSEREPKIRFAYFRQENGFYQVCVSEDEREELKERFQKLGFSALNFTDSRSVYQFYHLAYLWEDIQTALKAGIKLWHPATPPVSAGELYQYLTGDKFVNELGGIPAHYDYKTIYNKVFDGSEGYICRKDKLLDEIKEFTEHVSSRGNI